MDITLQLKSLGEKFKLNKKKIKTEEATKNAFVMPFIAMLGYNVFDPDEVIPEFTADIGIKKGEKVDYCIVKNGQPIIIMECKGREEDLTKHSGQLFRYFHVTKARFAILTNGHQYNFYSDLNEKNIMDTNPFLTIDITNVKPLDAAQLERFKKDEYDEKKIVNTAGKLKNTNQIVKYLNKQFTDPDESFVKFIAGNIYDGRLTKNALFELRESLHKAMDRFISGVVSDKLEESFNDITKKAVEKVEKKQLQEENSEVVTTLEELEGFFAVKSIVKGKLELGRVCYRDAKSYFGILIDDNNRKPLCRLHFNGTKKYLGIFKDGSNTEEKIHIENIDQIYKHGSKIRKRVDFLI